MEMNGEEFINAICKRLRFRNRLCYDSTIVSRIRELTDTELREIITFGYPAEWIKDENINDQNAADQLKE